MANIKYITSEELKQMYGSNDILICDIREADEYNREHIVGAKNFPLSNLQVNKLDDIAKSKKLILHCQSGNRTKMNEKVFKNINCDEVMILCDGINAWKKQGCAIAKNNKAPLPLMRQVQIIAGCLILFGIILSYTVSKDFILLSGFVGLGLLVAGVTGFCGMANILMLLPYNKNNGCNNACN